MSSWKPTAIRYALIFSCLVALFSIQLPGWLSSVAGIGSGSAARSALFSTFTYSDTLTAGSPTYNRPLANGNNAPTSLSSQTAVRYQAQTFTVDTTGVYTLTNLSNTFNTPAANDSFFSLYSPNFSPSSPLANCLQANDNGPGLGNRSQITRTLTAGVIYVLVTSPFSTFSAPSVPATGSFTNEITGPGTTSPGPVCPFITVSPSTIPSRTIATPYPTTTFTAAGGSGNYTFSLSGVLPTGMSFVNGVLSGTPTQAGGFSITVTADDTNAVKHTC
jgi:hypothetical protein